MKNKAIKFENLNFATIVNQFEENPLAITDFKNHVKGFTIGGSKFFLRKNYRKPVGDLDYLSIGKMTIKASEDSDDIFFLEPAVEITASFQA